MKSFKVLIDTHLRCKPNLIQSAMLYRYLLENDHEITFDENEADFFIINTCGGTDDNQQRCVNFYHNYMASKKSQAKVIMYGCMVLINPERVNSLEVIPIGFDDYEKLDNLFYTRTKFETIHPYCDDSTRTYLLNGKKKLLAKQPLNNYYKHLPFSETPYILSKLFISFSKKMRANYQIMNDPAANSIFVEIGRGCIGKCSYCSIKKAKGNLRSRTSEDIINDIKQIYDPAKNLFLIADDCSSYGMDIGNNIFQLIYDIHKQFPGIQIGLNFLGPMHLEQRPEEHFKLFKEANIRFVELPMQSGSQRLINGMYRRYNPQNVVALIKQLRQISPKTMIFSNFIVGYPDERFFDFFKTIVAASYFDLSVPNIYSEMKDTVASKLTRKKSQYHKIFLWFIFLLMLNIFMVYRLKTHQIS